MISFYSLTAVKKLGTLRVIGLYTSIAFVLVSLSLLSSPSPSDPRKTNHNSCYCLALRACVYPHSVRTARLREDSQRVFHRPPDYRFRYFDILDGISRPPFCISTDLFSGQLSVILEISPMRENKFSLSGIIPKSLFCSLMRHRPANVRLNVIGKIRVRRPAPS